MTYLPDVLDEFYIDETQELTIDEFLSKSGLENQGFYKIASSQLKSKERFEKNPEVNPIDYIPVKEHNSSYKEYKECIYILVYDGRIVKIGGTYTGMLKRHQSYNCGTRKARNKGTCSVTNFHITESQYAAILQGKTVEWYVYDVPSQTLEAVMWNKVRQVSPKLYTFYEAELVEMYKKLTGHRPLLSKNAGIE